MVAASLRNFISVIGMRVLLANLAVSATLGLALAKINVSEEQKHFKSYPNEASLLQLFHSKTSFAQHDASLFDGISKNALRFILDNVDFLSLITSKDIKALSANPKMCSMVGGVAEEIPVKSLSAMSFECFKFMHKSLKLNKTLLSTILDALPEKFFQEEGIVIFEVLQENSNLLSEKQLRAAVKSGIDCSGVKICWLAKMSAKQLEVFTASQYSQMDKWKTFSSESFVRNLPSHAFAGVQKKLEENTYKSMTKTQVENFGSALREDRCQSLRPELLSQEGLRGLNGECFSGYLGGIKYGETAVEIGRFLVFADEGILSTLSEEQASNIHPSDWVHFSGEQLQKLPAKSCAGIHEAARPVSNPFFIPTPVCFANLSPSHQIAFLKTKVHQLPITILKHVDSSSVDMWPKKLATLTSAIPIEMIQLLGTEISEKQSHPCTLLHNQTEVYNHPYLMAHMGVTCAKALAGLMPTNLESSFYRKLAPGMMIAPDDIRDEIMYSIRASAVSKLAKEKGFCKSLRHTDFERIRKDSRKFGSKCVMDFPFLERLLPAEVQSLGPDAFESFDLAHFKKLSDPLMLTPEQLQNLGSDYARYLDGEHPINAIPLEKMAAIGQEHLQRMTAQLLAGLTPDRIKALNKEQIGAIPAEAFRLLSDKHFQAIMLEGLSQAQMANFGKDLKGQSFLVSPAQKSRLSPEAAAVLGKDSRFSVPSEDSALSLVPPFLLGTAVLASAILLVF